MGNTGCEAPTSRYSSEPARFFARLRWRARSLHIFPDSRCHWRIFSPICRSEDRRFIEQMGRILQLRNHRNIGADGLQLYVDCDLPADAELRGPGSRNPVHGGTAWRRWARPAASDLHGQRGRRAGPGRVVGTCNGAAQPWLPHRHRRFRGRAAGPRNRWIFSGPTSSGSTAAGSARSAARQRPCGCSRPSCRDCASATAKVLVNGIEDKAQFGIALRAGADFFQGPYLAAPALVGTVFSETPLGVADKLGETQKIVPLFG